MIASTSARKWRRAGNNIVLEAVGLVNNENLCNAICMHGLSVSVSEHFRTSFCNSKRQPTQALSHNFYFLAYSI